MADEEAIARGIREAKRGVHPWHRCRDCGKWYGAEDDEYGPCLYKNARDDDRFVTHGGHYCDEAEELRQRGLLP